MSVNGNLVLMLVNGELVLVLGSGSWTWVGRMMVFKQYDMQ